MLYLYYITGLKDFVRWLGRTIDRKDDSGILAELFTVRLWTTPLSLLAAAGLSLKEMVNSLG